MKRYRVLSFDFDSRAITLEPIQDHWEDSVKELHLNNQERTIHGLQAQYGTVGFESKLANFKDLGSKPFSVVAFHNRFLTQARHAFVHGQYYPALTAVCALGERVLNHLVINLRDNYKAHGLYKKVYRKDSFDYWPLAIDALSQWGVLTPEAETAFRTLAERRNRAIHFNPEVEKNDRDLALAAIKTFQEIVAHQFASFANLPWLLPAPGECFICKDWERDPFVQLVYVPNSAYVGYKHSVVGIFPWRLADADDYPDQEVCDDEFLRLRADYQTFSLSVPSPS